MTEPNERLKQARERRGFRTAADAARYFNWNVVTFRSHENGTRPLSRKAALQYASGLRVSAGWLLYGEAEQKQTPAPVSVPVRGTTACGLWAENGRFTEEEFPPVPAVPTVYSNVEQFAFKVEGNCMDKLRIVDGDFVVCVPYWTARSSPGFGDIVVVERRRGHLTERTCKQIEIAADRVELCPRSSDARYGSIVLKPDLSPVEDGVEVEIVGLVIGRYAPL